MPVRRRDDEEGFTMIVTVIGMSLIALLVLVAVTAVNGDAHLTTRDLARKQAYEAAKAGIDEYAYRLHVDTAYWAKCTDVGTNSAVNQEGETNNRRSVPGLPGARYAIELIPVAKGGKCDSTSPSTATATMLQPTEPMKGTFRIRSNGYFGDSHVAIMALFKPASFLDYVYFTQYETSDPTSYANEELKYGAEHQCEKYIREGRTQTALVNQAGEVMNEDGEPWEWGDDKMYCEVISFGHNDNIKGPMHTNDAFVICKDPILGRDKNDPIEVGQLKGEKFYFETRNALLHSGSSCEGKPQMLGEEQMEAGIIIPPATNGSLESIAGPEYNFREETAICLEGETFTVGSGHTCSGTPRPFPASGVIYVSSETCSENQYSPFNLEYPETPSDCANVNVSGTYAKPLTIAAQNDVIIRGNLTKTSEEAMLGLIANNFIRIFHPANIETKEVCEFNWDTWQNECHIVKRCLGNADDAIRNVSIEAALLAIQHSFVVDNFRCGSSLGTLKVKGAIAQKFRGAVGTFDSRGNSASGFVKDYEYDDRMKLSEPPSFIQPIEADWVIGRETTE